MTARALTLGMAIVAVAATRASADPAGGARALLGKLCSDCHGEETQKGQIRLDRLAASEGDQLQLLAKVYQQLADRTMPPENKQQPSEEERAQIQNWVTGETAAYLAGAGSTPRRLNRRELSAALQDLTGVPIDFGAGLPMDATIDGFDTGAIALQDAADSVAQMLEVTRRAVESIRFLEPDRGKQLRIDFRQHDFTDFRKWIDQRYKDEGIFTRSKSLRCREGVGLYLKTEWSGDRGNSFLALPAPVDKRAAMTVKLRLAAKRPMPGLPQPMLWVKIGGKYIDYQQVVEEPRTLTYAVRMEDHLIEDGAIKIMLRSVVEIPYAVDGFENDDRSKPEDKIPGGIGVYRPKFDRKVLRDPQDQPLPSTVVESVEIDYDYRTAWPPEDWGVAPDVISDDDDSAGRLLSIWAERAWRRPPQQAELERFFDLYRHLRAGGSGFDEALRATFQAVLMGGSFRYQASPADPDPAIAQHAIATRLSFMLAGAPPDQELLALAAAGQLRDPDVLGDQVDRLLEDSRSMGFFRPFVIQWLALDQPITLTMSHLQKQDFRFGRHLKASLKDETVEYVARLFADNRPAVELIASDWTMMNDILAVHYGREPIEGSALRKVTIAERPDDPRGGGLLGHAGIQSMLCWMGDNWVIYRGAWALRHILDDPQPAPPLDVPELNPSDGANRGKSFRELMVQHQEDRRCSICHETIDPMGFAFQNFDISGRWRSEEFHHYIRKELDGKIEWRGEGDSRPVDTLGRLPRGEEFSSYSEFKRLLSAHYIDDVVRGILKKLTLFGTGRQPHAVDLANIQAIMDRHRAGGYQLRDLIKELVSSPIFLESSNQTGEAE